MYGFFGILWRWLEILWIFSVKTKRVTSTGCLIILAEIFSLFKNMIDILSVWNSIHKRNISVFSHLLLSILIHICNEYKVCMYYKQVLSSLIMSSMCQQNCPPFKINSKALLISKKYDLESFWYCCTWRDWLNDNTTHRRKKTLGKHIFKCCDMLWRVLCVFPWMCCNLAPFSLQTFTNRFVIQSTHTHTHINRMENMRWCIYIKP